MNEWGNTEVVGAAVVVVERKNPVAISISLLCTNDYYCAQTK